MLGENPFLSAPNVNEARKGLTSLEFLAVQDIFLTEMAEFADVVLPATSALEKLGTFTNTDRRVQIGRPLRCTRRSADQQSGDECTARRSAPDRVLREARVERVAIGALQEDLRSGREVRSH